MSSAKRSSHESGKYFDISAMSTPSGWEQCQPGSSMTLPTVSYDLEIASKQSHPTTPAEDTLAASTWKRLAQSQSSSLAGVPESSFTSMPDEEIQAWAKEYFRRKNKNFDSSAQMILSNFIGNFYGLATSLIDCFVDHAISEAINRGSSNVEQQDFTFVDFDLHVENISPSSAQLKYKMKHLSKEGFMCPSCGKVPASSSVFGGSSTTTTGKPARRNVMMKAHAGSSSRSLKKQKISHHGVDTSSGMVAAPSQSRRPSSGGHSSLGSDITNGPRQGSSLFEGSQNQDLHLL